MHIKNNFCAYARYFASAKRQFIVVSSASKLTNYVKTYTEKLNKEKNLESTIPVSCAFFSFLCRQFDIFFPTTWHGTEETAEFNLSTTNFCNANEELSSNEEEEEQAEKNLNENKHFIAYGNQIATRVCIQHAYTEFEIQNKFIVRWAI